MPGDVIVLTKPIGTQVAVNAREWVADEHKWDQVKDLGVSINDVDRAFKISVGSMSRLNRTGSVRWALSSVLFERHGF